MATKKRSAKLSIGSDPPVLIGGGGSSFIWVKFNENQTPQNPNGVSPNAPAPNTKSAYSLSKITSAPVRLFFNNGEIPGSPGEEELYIPVGPARDRWYIRFAMPGEKKRGVKKRGKKAKK